jgi:biotin carboxylase
VARVLLLLPTATYRAPEFLAAAATLGVEVVIGSEHRQAMADAMGDRAVVIPLATPYLALSVIEALHQRTPLDAVVAVDDQGVLVAALAGQRLGLVHNPPEAVAATRDKAAMRRRLAAAGIPQPVFSVVGPRDDVGAAAERVGLPCVVKAVSLSASRGVIRSDSPVAATEAARRVRVILAEAGEDGDGPLLVESFVGGPEVAVEGLLISGALHVLAVFDKPDLLDGPYFEETIYVTPSRHPSPKVAAAAAAVEGAARALGLREGPIHAEARLPPGEEVRVLEVAARSIGGLCARSLRFGLGVSLEELILRHALGLGLESLLDRERLASGVMMLPITAAGTLRRVAGQADARAVPGIVGLEMAILPGRPVRPLPEGDRYLGFLFARAETPALVEAALREAHSRLDVVIDRSAGL